eukprot:XP_013997771.1 PREDICTED: septin-10-like [Salmo salar]
MSKPQTRHGKMPPSDSPSSDSADASSEEAPAWFRMEMNKGITKIQETLPGCPSKIDVLVNKLHKNQKVTKGQVSKLEKDHADHQAAILDVCEDVDQKYKKCYFGECVCVCVCVCVPPGESVIGKSTLMDTLLNTNFENCESSHFKPHVKLRAQTYNLQENVRLTVVNSVCFCVCLFQVNVIPVTAKFKIKIMSELVSKGVQIYLFSLDDETVAKVNTQSWQLPAAPAVVGSTEEVMVRIKMVKARQYPCGVVQQKV